MRLRNRLFATLALAVMVSSIAAFRPAPDPAAAPDIEAAMRTIKETIDSLRDTLEDKDKTAENLTAIEKLEEAFMTCKTSTPPKAEGLEGKDRDKFMVEYRTLTIETLQLVLDMEKEVVAGKGKNAKKLLNKVAAMKGKGHGKFKDGR